MKKLGFTHFFSYWIFVWFLCFQFGVTEYNPVIWIWIAFYFELFFLGCMIYYRNDLLDIFIFFVVAFSIKVVPIIVLRKYPFHWEDFQAGLVLFVFHCLYLGFNNHLFYYAYYQHFLSIQKNESITPFTVFIKERIKLQKSRVGKGFGVASSSSSSA
jgi:hypothetical protein